MKNEKIPLIIAVVLGAAAFVLFEFEQGKIAMVLTIAAVAAAVFFAAAKWHNLQEDEMEGYKKALRECQEKNARNKEDKAGGKA